MRDKCRDKHYCGVRKSKIARAQPCIDENAMLLLLKYIVERYRIHIKKDILGIPAPWTKDRVLQTYRFTNVFREDDKVSSYLIDAVSTNPHLTLEEKVLNSFLFRAWNNPATFEDFGGPWCADDIYNGLELKEIVRPIYHKLLRKDPERKWWSNAYLQGGAKYSWRKTEETRDTRVLSPGSEPDIPLRVFHIGVWLESHNVFDRLISAKNQKEAYEVIHELRGFSSFLAYQVFVDLTYIKDFPFSENEFVIVGPGCKKGMDLLFTDYDDMTHEEALFFLRDNIDECFLNLYRNGSTRHEWDPEKLFKDRPAYDRRLNLMSLENCFCEFSKYMRARNGKTRLRYY